MASLATLNSAQAGFVLSLVVATARMVLDAGAPILASVCPWRINT